MNITGKIKDIPLYKQFYKDLLDSEIYAKDLHKLPILTKKEISNEFPENWMTEEMKKLIKNKEFEFMNTSGTTEERIMLIRPKNWWLEIEKRLFRYIKKLVPSYSDMQSKAILTTAICSNTICYKEAPPYEKRLVNGILHLNITQDPNNWTKEDLQRMVDEINIYKPQCFQADPIYLSLFFKSLHKHKLELPKWKPFCLLLAYEFCPQKCLDFIHSFWDIQTHIIYGTTELGIIFYENLNGLFNLMNDDTYLFLKPLEDKENFYEVILTSFRNPYMPLVNYNTGDLVYIDPKLAEKNNEVLISQLMGRTKDLTYTSNNNKITVGEIDNILAKQNNDILTYQLDFSYNDKIIFRYTTSNDKELATKQILKITLALSKLYEDNYRIEINHEIEILPAPSGKFNIIKKDYKNEQF